MFPALNSLSILFLVLFLLTNQFLFLILALLLLVINTFFESVAEIISKYMEKTLKILGQFISKVILTLIFYLFLTPIALLYRLKNSNPLDLIPNSKTLWKERNKDFVKEDFEKPF